MITVNQATEFLHQKAIDFPLERRPLANCLGLVLQEGVYAERDAPPFPRVCMDGVAISLSAWNLGLREFALEGLQKAGGPVHSLQDPLKAIEVMTGAPLPLGCDGVIPYEECLLHEGLGRVQIKRQDYVFRLGDNIQPEGLEHHKGDLLVPPGTLLLSPHLGIAASSGLAELLVRTSPPMAIVSTGDELVDFGMTPLPYQIRRSNPWAIQAELHAWGVRSTELFHIRDRADEMREILKRVLDNFPIVIISGGVSKGKFDLVPLILQELGVEQIFHQVAQRPGKPFWFGRTPGNMVFGLPGNPCSALITLRRYLIPLFQKILFQSDIQRFTSVSFPHAGEVAELAEDFQFNKPLTLFLPVLLSRKSDGGLLAKPSPTKGSGDYGALGSSHGFVELEIERDYFPQGHRVKLYRWGGVFL